MWESGGGYCKRAVMKDSCAGWLKLALLLLLLLLASNCCSADATDDASAAAVSAFLADLSDHFQDLPVRFVHDGGGSSADRTDLQLSTFAEVLHRTRSKEGPPHFFFHFVQPADLERMGMQEDGGGGGGGDDDRRDLILVPVSSARDRALLRAASESGMMETGIWLLPKHLVDEGAVVTRYDSNVYLYNVVLGDRGGVSAVFLLEEVFSIKRRHRFTNFWGNWTSAAGLTLGTPHMWERRMGFLKGVVLRGVTLAWTPFAFVEREEDGSIRTYGILIDAIRIFQEQAGFTFLESEPRDGNWGAPLDPDDPTGEWNGLVRDVMDGLADIGHSSLSVTPQRSMVVSYGEAVYVDKFTFIIKQPDGAVTINFWAYVNVFTVQVWIATLAAILLGSFVHGLSRQHQAGQARARGGGGDGLFLRDLGAVSTVYLQRDLPVRRTGSSYRLVHAVNCLTGFVIFSFYSGVLTSLMTAAPATLDINSFQDILDKEYQTVVIKESSDSLTMQTARKGTALHDIYYKTMAGKPEVHLNTPEEAFAIILSEPNYAMFSSGTAAYGFKGVVALNLREAIADTFAPIFPKDSELLGVYDHFMYKLKETGVLHKIVLRYFGGADGGGAAAMAAEATELGFDNLFFPGMVGVLGAAAAFAVLAGERAADVYHRRKVE